MTVCDIRKNHDCITGTSIIAGKFFDLPGIKHDNLMHKPQG